MDRLFAICGQTSLCGKKNRKFLLRSLAEEIKTEKEESYPRFFQQCGKNDVRISTKS